MFSSSFSTFNSSVSPTRVCVDNNNSMVSYLVDDFYPNSKQDDPSYYNYQYSPLIHNYNYNYNYNEMDIFGESSISHQELTIIQQALRLNSSIVTEDSSTFEVTNKTMDFNNKGEETVNGIVEDGNHNKNNEVTRPIGSIKRRRTSKRDRHSKIRTAHGLRDRRMRLSLEVACPFFNLQDMLGFDKGSSTVEWLLIQSKPAIEELFQTKNASLSGVTKCSMSNSTSNCEVESTMVEEIIKKGPNSSKPKRDRTMPKQKRKRTTKESREEARARARKRTLERMETRLLPPNNHDQISRSTHSIQTRNIINHGSLSTEDYSSLSTFNYPQSSDQISQIVPSYRILTQPNMMGGPRLS